jgi:NADH-quinone oxidoreductase subunit D
LARIADVGLISKYLLEVYALSGVVVRANDFRKDLRLVGYSYYSRIEFNVVLGIKGDSMDRYLVRMNESLESVKILNTCSLSLTTWYLSNNYTEGLSGVLTNMESMIHYFKLVTEGYTFTVGQTYLRQESPKGELGCLVVHGQTTHPCRVNIRAPDYSNLQALDVLSTDT